MIQRIRAPRRIPSSPVKAAASSDVSEDEEDMPVSSDPFDELSKFFGDKGKGKAAKPKARTKKDKPIGPSGKPYTPLEQQILELKKKYPSPTILMVEKGYKYVFYGDDAKVAAKELGMVCYMDRNFLVASIPTHRRDIHLKKLLSHGYKVGIVNQTETAALKKAGDNRNTIFERSLTRLVTAATFVDELDDVEETDQYSSARLVCVVEKDDSHIGFVCVAPSDGEVIWDAFDDTRLRIELETRMAHLRPQELLIPRVGLSKYSKQMLEHLMVENSSAGSKARIEYFDDPFKSSSEAFDYITSAYDQNAGQLLAAIADLPKTVVTALAYCIRHLAEFNIAAPLLEPRFFVRFTSKAHMLLGANTLSNLEIFQNETDMTVKGSLLSILDHTDTRFGKRMLKSWIGAPLVDKDALQERIDTVEEIVAGTSRTLHDLRQLLKKLPDLAKGLSRIQYRQCPPSELVMLLQTFHKLGAAFPSTETAAAIGFKSPILNRVIFSLPPLLEPMRQLLDELEISEAESDNKARLWTDPQKFPKIETHTMAIGAVQVEIADELKQIRATLKIPSLEYTTCAGERYLVEIKTADKKRIPLNWPVPVSQTKYIKRYRSPVVEEKLKELSRWEESLSIESDRAFLKFFDEVGEHYAIMRQAVQQLATIDCLFSLAQVALNSDNYVKPTFVDDSDVLEIVHGRHPMIEVLRTDPFIPNSISFTSSSRCKVLTGPNMGGKSSCVRMIALIVIMAQIGSYVPAESVKLGLIDGVWTRMGAYDELSRGRSTFMVEMSETSEILKGASPRSLVILDELGRGTSTFDGMSIAHAVLEHAATSIRCKTLFITHYPLVAVDLEKKFPDRVHNHHVGYRSEVRLDGRRDVTFLYQLEEGMAPASFGVECARLAGLPESILEQAARRSRSMEELVAARTRQNLAFKRVQLLEDVLRTSNQAEVAGLLTAMKSTIS
uniref:MutS protein homolog 3 n=1 Tax=Mycena chlorophos TaxID=658473 RepID=A0ABQ0KYV4_MYCCL|nr:DNA mismatch repair protein [Mycena chlorophos]